MLHRKSPRQPTRLKKKQIKRRSALRGPRIKWIPPSLGYENIAILEAKKLGIPVVGVVDTNTDPHQVDYIIPGNDDAIRAIVTSDAFTKRRTRAAESQ